MPARVSTADRTYKGRTISSIVRTQFGPKAVFTATDGGGGVVTVDGARVAEITYASEWKRVKPVSRAQRWAIAVEKLQDAQALAEEVYGEYEDYSENHDEDEDEEFDTADAEARADAATSLWSDGISALEELQSEYQDWYDNLPDALQYDSPVAEKLQEVINLSFEYVEFSYDDDPSYNSTYIDEYEYVDLPLGWGRD